MAINRFVAGFHSFNPEYYLISVIFNLGLFAIDLSAHSCEQRHHLEAWDDKYSFLFRKLFIQDSTLPVHLSFFASNLASAEQENAH